MNMDKIRSAMLAIQDADAAFQGDFLLRLPGLVLVDGQGLPELGSLWPNVHGHRMIGLVTRLERDNTQAITDDIAADGSWDNGERHLPGLYRARNYVDELIQIAE